MDVLSQHGPADYTTDFVGHVLIDPPLNDGERDYLTAFTTMRHWDRPGGPYVLPDHPLEPVGWRCCVLAA